MYRELARLALALQNKPRVSNDKIIRVLRSADSKDSALDAAAHTARPIVPQDWKIADSVLAANERLGITSCSFVDPQYPLFLKDVKDPPALIHLRGNVEILNDLPGVAVVGTRNASENGREIARRLGRYFAEHGWIVVSGLALGVDAAAHEGALDGKGKTIAVLAGGLDKASPKRNEQLADDILGSGGAWISEQPVGEPPQRQHFVPRNRIQVGLSAGSIIVEAEERSGSISQANFCVEIGRPLFAVMPLDDRNLLGLRYSGAAFLVRKKGAIAIRSKGDYDRVVEILKSARAGICRSEHRKASTI